MTATTPGQGLSIDVEALVWRPYGRREPVLDGLDLHVPAGQRVLLVGPSGSGKSTLLRAVAGVLETADAGDRSGTVRLGGSDDPAPGAAGLVLQDPGAGVVAATVARDVAFGLENRQVPRDEMAAVVTDCLDRVGLVHLADAPTATLSGGESQRLALAGALALQPGVLLLDEPLAMLDAVTAEEVVRTAVDAAQGLTLVVVEHRIGPWLPHVDRLLVMDARGALVADGPPGDVLARRRADLLDLGVWVPGEPDPQPLALPGLFTPRSPSRLDVEHVTVERTTLAANRPPRVARAVVHETLHAVGGHALALVGPSGAGKSSLVLALAGLEEPVEGRVLLDDAPVAGLAPVPAHVGWVPQSPAAGLVARTVADELRAGPDAAGTDPAVVSARVDDVVAALGLAQLRDAQTATLSGGEQRRLAVAAAVLAQPRLLLTDEMTIGQDRHTWAAVVGLAEELRAAGSVVVHATHDAGLVARCDAVHTLHVRPQGPASATRRPLAAHAGPLSLALAAAVAVLGALAVSGWRDALVGLGVEAILGTLALWAPGDRRLPAPPGRWRTLAWRLGPMLLGALGLAWSTWLLGGRDLGVAAGAGLRLLVGVVPSAVLLPLVDPDALGDHLAQRLRLPARPVVAVTAALQRLQGIADLRTTLERARRMRGRPTGGAALPGLALGLLVDVLGSASRLALAMDARGFARAHRRTWAARAPWRPADTLVVALGIAPVTAVVVARGLLAAG